MYLWILPLNTISETHFFVCLSGYLVVTLRRRPSPNTFHSSGCPRLMTFSFHHVYHVRAYSRKKGCSSSNPSGWLGNGLEIILHGSKPRPELLPTLFICSIICWGVRHVTHLNHASPRQCIACALPLQSSAQIQYVQHLGVLVMCQCREHQALLW